MEELYLKKLNQIVDKIIIYSKDEKIFNIPTIRTKNGIDLESVEISIASNKSKHINLLVLALFQKHHGYERLINGIAEYYGENNTRKVIAHFVGDGPGLQEYRDMVEEKQLEEYILFYGRKSGNELEAIYRNSDIGITTRGHIMMEY